MAYIGRDLRTGAFRQLADISSGFDGSDTTHTMQVNSTNVSVGDVNQILLSLGGVIQKPGTDFTISGSTLTFTTAPASGLSFFAILLGSDNGGTVTPTDGSVTTDKIAADQITKAKLADSIDIFAGTSLSAADLGAGVHIKTGDSGGSAHSSADELIVEASGSGGLQILTANDESGRLYFGDDGSTHSGFIEYSHEHDRLEFGTSASTRIKIDSTGAMTNTTQPAFQVRPSSNQNNMATGATIVFGTEVFDQNSDFASNTFTAPVTGKYQLSFNIRLQQLQDDSSYALINIQTSNRTYQHILALAPHVDGDVGYQHFSNSLLCDMDANDTAYLVFQESGGTTGAVDVSATESDFTGFLAC